MAVSAWLSGMASRSIPPAAVAALLISVGCSSGEKTAAKPATRSQAAKATQPGTRESEVKEGAHRDGIAVSALREQALTLLTEAATAGPPEVRVNALEALSTSPRRLEPILRAALVDPAPAVRITAAVVVGNVRLESSASFVEPLTRDPVLAVRASAVYALRRCKHETELAPLAELLADPSPPVAGARGVPAGETRGPLGPPDAGRSGARSVPAGVGVGGAADGAPGRRGAGAAGGRRSDPEHPRGPLPRRSEDLEATALAAQLTGELNDRASARELVMLTRMRDDAGKNHAPRGAPGRGRIARRLEGGAVEPGSRGARVREERDADHPGAGGVRTRSVRAA